jgi:hypothetical protein
MWISESNLDYNIIVFNPWYVCMYVGNGHHYLYLFQIAYKMIMITTAFNVLEQVARENSFAILDVPYDGDCLFSSIAYQLEPTIACSVDKSTFNYNIHITKLNFILACNNLIILNTTCTHYAQGFAQ